MASIKRNVSLGGGTNSVNMCTLYEGDADDTGQVNIQDFSILAYSFGKSRGQQGFDWRADFNNSTQVNIRDFSLLAANYAKNGAQNCTASAPQASAAFGHLAVPLPQLDAPATGTVALRLSPSSTALQVGQIGALTLGVAAGTQRVSGVAAYINYDPTVLQVVSAAGNPVTRTETASGNPFTVELENSVDQGWINYSAGTLSQTPPNGNFNLIVIRFKALAGSSGSPVYFVHDADNNRNTDATYGTDSVLGSTEDASIAVPVRAVVVDPEAAAQSGDPGSSVVYSLQVTNTGNLTDTFNVTISGNRWSTRAGRATVGPLAGGDAVALPVTVTVPAGALGNTSDVARVKVASQATGTVNDTAVLTTTANYLYGVLVTPDRSAKSGTSGTQVRYTLNVKNTGNTTDYYDIMLEGNNWPVTSTVTTPNVNRGARVNAFVTVTIPSDAIGSSSDAVTVTVTSHGNMSKYEVERLTTTATPVYNVAMDPASAGQIADPGDVVTYTLYVTNTGNLTETYAVTRAGNRWNSALSTASIADLPGGQSASVDVVVTVPLLANRASDTAVVTVRGQHGARTDTARLTTTGVVTRAVDLSPASPTAFGDPGGVAVYTFAVTNTGNLTDTYRASLVGGTWARTSPRTVGPLAPGAAAEFVMTVTVPAGTRAGTVQYHNIQIASTARLSTLLKNVRTTTCVNPVYRVQVTPPVSSKSGRSGTVAIYALTVRNTGSLTDTYNVTVQSELPVTTTLSSSAVVPGRTIPLTVRVGMPYSTTINTTYAATVTVTSVGDPDQTATATLTTRRTAAPVRDGAGQGGEDALHSGDDVALPADGSFGEPDADSDEQVARVERALARLERGYLT